MEKRLGLVFSEQVDSLWFQDHWVQLHITTHVQIYCTFILTRSLSLSLSLSPSLSETKLALLVLLPDTLCNVFPSHRKTDQFEIQDISDAFLGRASRGCF